MFIRSLIYGQLRKTRDVELKTVLLPLFIPSLQILLQTICSSSCGLGGDCSVLKFKKNFRIDIRVSLHIKTIKRSI